MSTSIRIQDNAYSRLENNAKGYESVSDTIDRAVSCLEFCDAFEMISHQVESSISTLNDEGITRKKVLLVHFQKLTLEKVMLLIKRLHPNNNITYEIEINALTLLVEEKSV